MHGINVKPAARVVLGGYLLANLALHYDIAPRLRLSLVARNLTDARYEELLGYGTPGISLAGGARFLF